MRVAADVVVVVVVAAAAADAVRAVVVVAVVVVGVDVLLALSNEVNNILMLVDGKRKTHF